MLQLACAEGSDEPLRYFESSVTVLASDEIDLEPPIGLRHFANLALFTPLPISDARSLRGTNYALMMLQ